MSKKKIIVSIVVILIIVAIPAAWYQYYWSFSSLLRANGFTEDDIIHRELHAFDDKRMIHIVLLLDENKLAMVGALRNDWGKWSSMGQSKADLHDKKPWVTVGFSNMLGWGEVNYVEKHVFVAAPVGDRQSMDGLEVPFELSIQYLDRGENTILFAHAVSDQLSSFGSEDVLPYLRLR